MTSQPDREGQVQNAVDALRIRKEIIEVADGTPPNSQVDVIDSVHRELGVEPDRVNAELDALESAGLIYLVPTEGDDQVVKVP